MRGHKEEIFTRCNVDGSLRLMQAAKESGFCQRFLFISSLAARHPELSWYANSKHVAEQQLTAMADAITLGVFRPTAVYGPGDKELKPLASPEAMTGNVSNSLLPMSAVVPCGWSVFLCRYSPALRISVPR